MWRVILWLNIEGVYLLKLRMKVRYIYKISMVLNAMLSYKGIVPILPFFYAIGELQT